MKNLSIIVISLLFTVSCSFVPLKQKPLNDSKIPESFDNAGSVMIDRDSLIVKEWWKKYNDPQLNESIDMMLENNLDLKLALSRLNMLESQHKSARGSRLPSAAVSGGYSETDKKIPLPMGGTKDSTATNYSAGLALKYELDIWGKVRANHLAVKEAYKASKADLQTIYNGLIVQTVVLHYNIIYQADEVRIAERKLQQIQHRLNITEKKYKKGIIPKAAFETVKQGYNNTRMMLSGKENALNNLKNQLAVLLGEYPEKFAYPTNTEQMKHSGIIDIPEIIPSELLKQRGDIVSAEHSMESARQSAGAAFADLFPSISISAVWNFASMDFDDLFEETSMRRTLSGEVSQAVFTGGAKTYNYKSKKKQYEQAVISYKKTVLNAFSDVENALKTLMVAKESYRLSLENKNSAESVHKINTEKYKSGLLSYIDWQDSETAFLNSVSAMNSAFQSLISAETQLHRALGGNWF